MTFKRSKVIDIAHELQFFLCGSAQIEDVEIHISKDTFLQCNIIQISTKPIPGKFKGGCHNK